MVSKINELVELLEKTTTVADIKLKGWEYLLGVTATDDGIDVLLRSKFIPFLLSSTTNCLNENHSLLSLAYKCFINVSSNKDAALKLLSHKEDFVIIFLKIICNSSFEFIEPICQILNNLSSHGTLWNGDELEPDFMNHIETLTKLFISKDASLKEKYKFISMVFSNMTRHAPGQKYFICNNKYFNKIFPICSDPEESLIRRLGVSFTMRNCCLDTDNHARLLKELDILPYLLLPLMGPEEYEDEKMEKLPLDCQYLSPDQVREENPIIRKTLVQALGSLCYTEEGWKYLKDHGVYFVSGSLHDWEEEPSVVEAIESLLLFLLVENYVLLNKDKENVMPGRPGVSPGETDAIRDLPDFVV